MKISIHALLLFFLLLQINTTVLSQKLSQKQFPESQMLQAGVWKDTDGHFINAHGGGILYHQGTYYWYGEIKKQKILLAGQKQDSYRVKASGISCYSSKDLKSWKFEKTALTTTSSDDLSDLDTGRVIERPKVIYNQKTRKFVMWMHMDNKDFSLSSAGVAVSNNPEGPFQYLGSIKPNGLDTGDVTLFRDDDGSGYLISASSDNSTVFISRLSDDYLAVTGQYLRISDGRQRSAPVLFKYGKKYYLITSNVLRWNPGTSSYAVSDTLLGAWKEMGNPCIGPFSETTFSSQGTFVLPIDPKNGKFLFMADRWNQTDPESSRYLWLPMEVKGDVINIMWSAKVPD
ncbi:glycoside hydrolase family 43 protein [Dyadobacter sp. CY356]|uniref:glycoside hydrolase family 43 protein n=1 Tax=Dyadobacter sp. CY356 TaxID=2906442 RepID=UPI001F2E6F8E|nr:glycoside hydrolase family 43 protein [Dyadobacter sp. CY356]MCF0058642.1 glycoside hydrolase family 43 protein [Dyadobacter sp. CY356]